MTRKKVKLEYITNDSARKATYKKRKEGVMKKLDELTTLCGVDACAIIYSPYETRPEVWPSMVGTRRVLSRFMSLPELEQEKKMVEQEAYLKQKISRASQQLEKIRNENRENEMTVLMHECLHGRSLEVLSLDDAMDLCFLLDSYSKRIRKRINYLQKMNIANMHQAIATQDAVEVAAFVVPFADDDGEASTSKSNMDEAH